MINADGDLAIDRLFFAYVDHFADDGARLEFGNQLNCQLIGLQFAADGDSFGGASRATDEGFETDEGAHYLGEIALVPVDSPIAQSGLLFYNTLFDENAACHFAFGQAYPACVPGGDDLPEDELVRRGINVVSTMHVDFMVGTEDLSIIGTTKDGREVTVFENGRFAL